jgi:hypothetical protein
MTHFKLSFVKGVASMSKSIILQMNHVQSPFVDKTALSPLICFHSDAKHQLTVFV